MAYPKLPDLATRFRYARRQAELTQQELADRSGVTRDVVARIETGQTKRPRELEVMAKVMNVSPAWLMFGEEKIDELDRDALEMALKFAKLDEQEKAVVRKLLLKFDELTEIKRFLD